MSEMPKESGCIESAIIENALVMIIVLERGGVVSAWNHAAEKITGYTSGEVIGSPDIWKLLYPDTKYRNEVTKKIISNLAARKYFENLETTIRTKGGEKRIIQWNTNEVTRKDGKYQIITIGLDITRNRELDEFRESIIENANVLITVLDQKGRVLVWNQAAEKITGYRREEVIGKGDIWKHLYPDPEYRKTITAWISSIIKERRLFENLDTTITTKAGEKRIIRWNTREINTGAQVREIAIGRDITRQRDLDAFQESVIDNANILITVLDAQGNVLVWNKAAEAITGYTKGEVIRKREIWKHLYPDPEYRKTITKRITKIINEDRYFENFETTIVNKKGLQRILAWNTREIEGGTQKREIAIARDITEQRKAEQALVAYIGEMAMRLKQPVEIVRENLEDTVQMVKGGKLSQEEICIILETQVRNASQILTNIVDFQQAIAEKDEQIPDAYRKFLEE